MFYRHEDEVININELTLMRKDYLLQAKKFLIRLFFRSGSGSLQFDDIVIRDKVFEEIFTNMKDIK